MNFKSAKREMAKLAGKKYFFLQYDYTRFIKVKGQKREEEKRCRVCVSGHHSHTQPTWKQALAALRNEINPPPPSVDNNQEPE